jgi:hypothetical protein
MGTNGCTAVPQYEIASDGARKGVRISPMKKVEDRDLNTRRSLGRNEFPERVNSRGYHDVALGGYQISGHIGEKSF